jgi:hypothetical protein
MTTIQQVAKTTWNYIMASILNCQERKGLVFHMRKKDIIKYIFNFMEDRCETPEQKAAYKQWVKLSYKERFNSISPAFNQFNLKGVLS